MSFMEFYAACLVSALSKDLQVASTENDEQ